MKGSFVLVQIESPFKGDHTRMTSQLKDKHVPYTME